MKKKNILVTLGLAFASVFALAGCNDSPADTTTNNSQSTPSTETSIPGTPTHVYYCAPDAADDGLGTKDSPMAFHMATSKVVPGDSILLADGVYKYNRRLNIGDLGQNYGDPNYPIVVRPETEDAEVIFDFSSQIFSSENRGIQLYANCWYFYDIAICGAGDNGMYISGSFNTIENCRFYNNRDSGLQLGRALSGDITVDTWPSYNLIKNCTSWGNFDDETYGENADGFAAKLTIGYGNVFDGCIAFRNSDDGWDMYAKQDSGNIGTAFLYNCVAFENGLLPYQIDRTSPDGLTNYKSYDTLNGDGIGFKLGGSTMEGDVFVENCLAFNNKYHGFSDNSNPGFLSLTNCTAVNNCAGLYDATYDKATGLVEEETEFEGDVNPVRGLKNVVNKSNNFDLARDTNSYNNYYGLLSYINNQVGYGLDDDDSTYNSDAFRGTAGYSIFQTNYSDGHEVYRAFTEYEDASIYSSSSVDAAFSKGTEYDYTKMTDSIFKKIDNVNAKCDSRDDIAELGSLHYSLRNDDMSVNMGELYDVVDESLLTFCEGKQIGSNLDKTSWDEYEHFELATYENCHNRAETYVTATAQILKVMCNTDAVYQDFEIPKTINNVEIKWTSSNPEILEILDEETTSVSNSVDGMAHIYTPAEPTKVTLTAELRYMGATATREFELTIMHRNQTIGSLKSSSPSIIRIDIYGVYNQPTISVLDASANTNTVTTLPEELYSLERTYRYAPDRNSQFADVDGIYTSVPGVYEVTCTATSLIPGDNNKTMILVYNVYVVDPNCNIDFVNGQSDIVLTANGFTVVGDLSNIDGYVYCLVSDKALTPSPSDIINNENVQVVEITTDTIRADFVADNASGKAYYAYYVVANKKNSFMSNVYSFSTTIVPVTTKAEFISLATTGKLNGKESPTTIFSLQNDLDFTGDTWTLVSDAEASSFSSLFNGNGHKISNIDFGFDNSTSKKTTNIFYKIKNGTLMNVDFENIFLYSSADQRVAIVGTLCGGYISDVHLTNVYAFGANGCAGMVGQIVGGDNYISQVQLVNDPDKWTYRDISAAVDADSFAKRVEAGLYVKENDDKENDEFVKLNSGATYVPGTKYYDYYHYVIATTAKYAGGIVGNIQMESTEAYVKTYINDCCTKGTIGDGNDTGGCVGGIIGRIKNEFDCYITNVDRCYFKGTIIAKGNYNGGIIGGFESGVGYTRICYNYSDCVIILNGVTFDAIEAAKTFTDQTYAHKNANPILGRYTTFIQEEGIYSYGNYGTWNEYTSSYCVSTSTVFTLSYDDEDTGERVEFTPTVNFFKNIYYDFDNIWSFNDTTKELSLK